MSSTGQIVGGVVGAVVGFFAGGNVALGASIGMAIGGAIDPPKGPDVQGPRLSDTSQQTATYGAAIPTVSASMAVSGNVFWIENNRLKEVESKESAGGKGGGGQQITTFSYYGTFALGLCECDPGESKTLGRIWIGGQLFYDPSNPNYMSASASVTNASFFTFYSGSASQLPDDRMQAALGVGNVPAYRGLCYLVFKDLPLEKYMNTIVGTRIKVEVLTGTVVAVVEQVTTLLDTPESPVSAPTLRFDNGVLRATKATQENSNPTNYLIAIYAQEWVVGNAADSIHFTGEAPLPPYPDIFFGGHGFSSVIQSDVDVCIVNRYRNPTTQIIGFDKSGDLVIDTGGIAPSVLPSSLSRYVIDRGEVFGTYDTYNQRIYKFPFGVHDYAGPGPTAAVMSSDILAYPDHFGVSENFIFAPIRSASTTTVDVVKIDRWTMATVATYTGAASAVYVTIVVVSDNEFYTCGKINAGDAPICRWVNGVIVDAHLNIKMALDSDPVERMLLSQDGVIYVLDRTQKLFAAYDRTTADATTLGAIVQRNCLTSGMLSAGDIDVTELTQPVMGYKTSDVSSIRSAIEPLRTCWPFDVLQAGYKLKFKVRGSSSVASISEIDLGATDGDTNAVKISESREMDIQIPYRVELTYFDSARDYEVGPAGVADRLNTLSVNVLSSQLPVLLTANDAAGIAEQLLYLLWLERYDFSFTLPPTWGHLEAVDTITLQTSSRTYTLRIVAINYLQDGRLEVSAKLALASIYSPNKYGQAGISVSPPLSLPGFTEATALDVPCLVDSMNTSGLLVAISRQLAGWPGGSVAQSWDYGQSWSGVVGATPPGAVVTRANAALGVGRADIVDTANLLYLGEMTHSFYSVTDEQLLAGENHFAVGAPGRWEIVGAKTATQQGDGSWILSNLLRGRFGTEWAMSLHLIYETVVLLDQSALSFISTETGKIGQTRLLRSVTNGQSTEVNNEYSVVYSGVNLECLSPVYLRGVRNAANDWSIDWVRRTRVGGEWRDYVDATLSEASESYTVEIYSDGTYATLKRTISGLTSAATTYTSAQQTTDFGSEQSTIYVKAYQNSAVVGAGYPVIGSLVASVATASPPDYNIPTSDPHWANVVLAMHFNGTNGGTVFTDEKGHTMTRYNVTTDTTNIKYGSASGYFPNDISYYLSTPAVSDFLLGSDDFTVDFWIYMPTGGGGKVVGIWSDVSTVGFSWNVRIWNTELSFSYSTNGSNTYINCYTGSLPNMANAWKHIEMGRSGTNVYHFVDGVLVNTFTNQTFTCFAVPSTKLLEVGRDGAGPLAPLYAYLDDLRVTKGVCRHTADFTPPIFEFPNQ